MIIFGDSGLPLAKAGQASWHRPHSMQANASRESFQERSVARPRPKVSEFSRSSGASAPLGAFRRKKRLTGPVNIWRYFECGT